MKDNRITCVDNIFKYDDYRSFLQDYFNEVKEKKKFFSHRYLANRAGFSSPSFVHQVIKGRRNLSVESTQKLKHGLSLDGKIANYFGLLVQFNQSKTTEDKEKYRSQLHEIRRTSEYYKLNKNHINYCRYPYMQVVRELVVHADWNGDFRKLSQMLNPSITPRQAEEAVETLVNLGMIQNKKGKYIQKDQVVTMRDVDVVYKKDMRRDLLLQGVEAVDKFSATERHSSSGVISMSEKCFAEVSSMIDDFRQKVFAKITDDEEVDRVYNLSLQLFPVSENLNSENGE